MHDKILGIEGVRVLQRGDYELRATFKPNIMPAVISVIRARRRRQGGKATPRRSPGRGQPAPYLCCPDRLAALGRRVLEAARLPCMSRRLIAL